VNSSACHYPDLAHRHGHQQFQGVSAPLLGGLAQRRFKFGEGPFDGIEVSAVGRQGDELSALRGVSQHAEITQFISSQPLIQKRAQSAIRNCCLSASGSPNET
jgi:hypothetical protein